VLADARALQTDFAERIPHLNVKYHQSNYNNYAMHNMYAVIYNQLVYETVEERFGKGEAVVFARSSFAGGQRWIPIFFRKS
jgi:alpha-glucosidase (family GH31 glycosyl hydrolase)